MSVVNFTKMKMQSVEPWNCCFHFWWSFLILRWQEIRHISLNMVKVFSFWRVSLTIDHIAPNVLKIRPQSEMAKYFLTFRLNENHTKKALFGFMNITVWPKTNWNYWNTRIFVILRSMMQTGCDGEIYHIKHPSSAITNFDYSLYSFPPPLRLL